MIEGEPPVAPARLKGRLPRITRYMALAIYYEDLPRPRPRLRRDRDAWSRDTCEGYSD